MILIVKEQQKQFLFEHIPHRINLLTTFRDRFYKKGDRMLLKPEAFRDLYRCSKDISILMVRFFCSEFGLCLPERENEITECKVHGAHYGADKVNLVEIFPISRKEDLKKVLFAANRALAHIHVDFVFHQVDSDVLVGIIDLVEEWIISKIYKSPNLYADAMGHPNNRMYL